MPWLERSLPIVMAAFTAAGVGLLLYVRLAKDLSKDSRRLYRRFGMLGVSAGLVGLIMYFFQWQQVPILTMRILWVVWFGGFAWWAWKIYEEHFRLMPAERAKEQERAAYEKWLPKPKNK